MGIAETVTKTIGCKPINPGVAVGACQGCSDFFCLQAKQFGKRGKRDKCDKRGKRGKRVKRGKHGKRGICARRIIKP